MLLQVTEVLAVTTLLLLSLQRNGGCLLQSWALEDLRVQLSSRFSL